MSWLTPLEVRRIARVEKKKIKKKICSGGKPPKAVTKTLHERILELRKRGFARFQIADMLEVSRTTISKHLNGNIKLICE